MQTKHYSVIEQELLVLVSGVNYFNIYLKSQTFKVFTDHKALTWLKTIKHTNSRLKR